MRSIFPRVVVLFSLSLSILNTPFTDVRLRADEPKAKTTENTALTLPPGFTPHKGKDGKEIPPAATKSEIEMGDKASTRLEKHPKVKFLDPNKDDKSKALHAKLNDMAQKLGRVSARPLIDYKVKIIEDDQVNAFTLPNGNVYFYTGLLDLLSSDDEIAAVMAHEISHNSCLHVLRGDKQAKKLSWLGLAAIAAALFGGAEGANIAAFTQYAMVGVMNGYSIDYEKEADAAGITQMIAAGYNPSAMATVMQRFEIEEKRRPQIDPGIFGTHPESGERVFAIEKQIRQAGLDFTPRAVSGGPQAVAVEDKDRVRVQYDDVTLMEFADSGEDSASLKRAQEAASRINELLRDNLQMHQLKTRAATSGNKPTAELSGQGVLIARVLPADAKLQNLSPLECAEKWRNNMKILFWRERLNGAL